jgi:hypothetical protein
MKKSSTTKRSHSKDDLKRLQDAQDEFLKIQQEIASFIKPKEFKEHSTASDWRDATCLNY